MGILGCQIGSHGLLVAQVCGLCFHMMSKRDFEGEMVQDRFCPPKFYKLFETMHKEMIGFVLSGCWKALMGPTGLPCPVQAFADARTLDRVRVRVMKRH